MPQRYYTQKRRLSLVFTSLIRCFQIASSQLCYQATAEIPLTKTQHLSATQTLLTIAVMSGKWTAFGNAMGWPLATAALGPEQVAEYVADMCAEFQRGELALAQAQAASVSMHLPVSAPVHVASQQSVGSQMLPTQQVGAPIFIGNQHVYWNSAPFAGQTYAVAGPPQLMMQQAAPPAPQADQENWNAAPDAATPAQVGQNIFTAGPVAPPAPAPRAVQAHCAPSAVSACLLPQLQSAAPQMPIDLTEDGNEVVASTPAPQRAGTKRARADSTSGAAAPKAKKAKVEKPKVERPKVVKEKKEKKAPKPKKQPKIFMSGLRLPTVAAANIAPSDNSSVPFQGETMTMEQQQQPQYQQQQFLAGDATKIFDLADDTTANAPEMMRIDSADPMWGGWATTATATGTGSLGSVYYRLLFRRRQSHLRSPGNAYYRLLFRRRRYHLRSPGDAYRHFQGPGTFGGLAASQTSSLC